MRRKRRGDSLLSKQPSGLLQHRPIEDWIGQPGFPHRNYKNVLATFRFGQGFSGYQRGEGRLVKIPSGP